MNLFLILWLADICTSISHFTVFIIAVTLFILGIIGFLVLVTEGEFITDMPSSFEKPILKFLKIYIPTILVITSISLLTPSSKTIYISLGINELNKAVNTVAESDTAKKAIELLNVKLDEYLKEAKKDK